jgi:hypothetical protein
VELINWVLEKMKNPDIFICETIESKMSEIIETINQTDSILEAATGWLNYLVTKIASPTINVAVVNINYRMVHLERSVVISLYHSSFNI